MTSNQNNALQRLLKTIIKHSAKSILGHVWISFAWWYENEKFN